jgi:hypothetical protein
MLGKTHLRTFLRHVTLDHHELPDTTDLTRYINGVAWLFHLRITVEEVRAVSKVAYGSIGPATGCEARVQWERRSPGYAFLQPAPVDSEPTITAAARPPAPPLALSGMGADSVTTMAFLDGIFQRATVSASRFVGAVLGHVWDLEKPLCDAPSSPYDRDKAAWGLQPPRIASMPDSRWLTSRLSYEVEVYEQYGEAGLKALADDLNRYAPPGQPLLPGAAALREIVFPT